LARLLLRVGLAEEAWSLLLEVEAAQRRALLLYLAHAAARVGAERVSPDEVESIWREYLEDRADDGEERVTFARLLFGWNRPDAAAAGAWRAFEIGRDTMGLGALASGAQFQQLGARPEQSRERTATVARAIAARFPGDPSAESARLALYLGAGGLPDQG